MDSSVPLTGVSSLSAEPEATSISKRKPDGHGRSGWRLGVFLSFLTALAILIFNVVLTIWSTSKYPVRDGVGTAHNGNCQSVDSWTLGLRFLINVLATTLLALSNYTMQCLSSPTRNDLDTAHASGRWMNIGLPGVRNLRHIHWSRTALWIGLIMSSVPVHLLYNSTIFKSLETQIYSVVVVNPAFLDTTIRSKDVKFGTNTDELNSIQEVQNAYMNHMSTFERLDNEGCIEAYAQPTISGRSDVILIADGAASSSSPEVFYYRTVNSFQPYHLPYSWICSNVSSEPDPIFCNSLEFKKNAANWTIEGEKIAYCLSRRVDEHCKLQFSVYLMVAVIACNSVKILCMLMALFLHTDDIIVTLGDGISSYLKKADPLTAEKCLLAASDVEKAAEDAQTYSLHEPLLRSARITTSRWGASVSLERWITSAVAFVGVLIIDASFLIDSAVNVGRDQGSSSILWTIGFGAVDSRALIPGLLPSKGTSSLVPAAALANLPQLLLSIAFVAYNGLFTSMLLAKEWHNYSVHRQPLRVSNAIGSQLSTRWLTLPYRYSLPLLAASSLLHFVASNSSFVVRVSIFKNDQFVNGISQLGWSPYPMLTLIIVGVIVITAAILTAIKKFRTSMPLVQSCSFAIAAACHPPVAELDAFKSFVQWGEIQGQSGKEGDIGHCSFSMDTVQEPQPGRVYS